MEKTPKIWNICAAAERGAYVGCISYQNTTHSFHPIPPTSIALLLLMTCQLNGKKCVSLLKINHLRYIAMKPCTYM